jgi:hypothetical protein
VAKLNQDLPQFGSAKPANTGGSQHCAQCEAMLADALDGTLSAEEQTMFDLHLAGCASCSTMLADARRGAAWLELLRTPVPEPSSALLERILARTSGTVPVATPNLLSFVPAPSPSVSISGSAPNGIEALPIRSATILPFRTRMAAAFHIKSISQTMLQPRLAMTAAMAFFSIGLTLNLTGVKLNELHASDLKPSSVKRSIYHANGAVVRYVDNLRAVYELESRVRDLQRSSDSDAPAAASDSTGQKSADPKSGDKDVKPGDKQSRPRSGSGTSRRQQLQGDPLILAAFHRANSPNSPRTSLVCTSINTSSTLQEGELV